MKDSDKKFEIVELHSLNRATGLALQEILSERGWRRAANNYNKNFHLLVSTPVTNLFHHDDVHIYQAIYTLLVKHDGTDVTRTPNGYFEKNYVFDELEAHKRFWFSFATALGQAAFVEDLEKLDLFERGTIHIITFTRGECYEDDLSHDGVSMDDVCDEIGFC